MAERKPTSRAGKGKAKADAATPEIPARYLKPHPETPLASVFAAGGPMPIGAGAAALAQTAMANLMQTLGYTTVEEVLAVLQVAKREIIRRLGLPPLAVEAFIQTLAPHANLIAEELRSLIASQTYTFGFALGAAHRPVLGPEVVGFLPALKPPPAPGGEDGGLIGFAGALGVAAGAVGGPPIIGAAPLPIGAGLPAAVNLISQLPNPVRNQGNRNTCVPHGTLVAYEHYRSVVNAAPDDLSEQFLWWACKQRDGMPTNPGGTTMTAGADSLAQAGVCPESDWPYNPTEIPGDVTHGQPPFSAVAAAAGFRPTQIIRVTATAVSDYKTVLASGRCVAFAVPVYASNFQPQSSAAAATVFASGRITLPAPGEQPIGGHCMCMVGYQDDASVPALGGGRFIIRNSYGPMFGAASAFGPGHGTIPYSYVAGLGQDIGIAFL